MITAVAPREVMAPTAQKPLDRMLAAFPDAYQKSNGWWAHDDNPRFDFLELPDGDIRIHSWTGRSADDILEMGRVKLTRAALYAKPGTSSAVQKRDKIDLPTLGEYMCLDWQFLMPEGYSDGYTYTSRDGRTTPCVKVGGYCTPDGREHTKHQVRLSLHGKTRFLWNQNTPGEIIPCGLHYLDRARAAGYLVIGEGGSDWATMTWHGIPFLGIPGADQAKCLDVELVKDIPVIYIIEEPDQAKKLRETGQGFYKNMRSHLRDHGYQGEIFSLRFMESTGYKDPSDLHKSIYAACKEQAESPFRQEVKKRFLAAIEQAIEQAIPEGNDSLFPVAKARDWSTITFEEFYSQVWAVTSEFLSPIQKGIVCYLFLYMRDTQPDELGWRIDAKKMAPAVGLRGKKGVSTFLSHLSYLHQKMGILGKEHRAIKEYMNDEDSEGAEQVRYKGTELYIQSKPSFYTPRGYSVVTQDQHKPGGPRVAVDECEYCGSRHLKHYAVQCVDCGHVMYPAIENEEQVVSEQVVVESTITQPDEQVAPEHPKMGVSENVQELQNSEYIYSVTAPQNGCLGNGAFSDDADLAELESQVRNQRLLFWARHENTMPIGVIFTDEYLRRLRTCLDSGDSLQVKAARDDIERRLNDTKPRQEA
jgi:hypothetical protein